MLFKGSNLIPLAAPFIKIDPSGSFLLGKNYNKILQIS